MVYDESGVARFQDLTTPAGRLVGERFVTETHSDDVLWPDASCGVRARERSVRVRWVLRSGEGERVVVDEVLEARDEVGLEFRSR